MKWEKQGLIYAPDGSSLWARHSSLQPTPLFLTPEIIRVYVGLRDEQGISRVGFVDVEAATPSNVLKVSERPALDIGSPGTFDENGVVPCAIVQHENELRLYYAGYQLGSKVKFFVFGGLAISHDGGESFHRYRQVPVLERSDDELFFRVAHSVMFDGGRWRIWYGAGSEWTGPSNMLPVYDVRYIESADGITFGPSGSVCIPLGEDEEYRIGRPYVIKQGDRYLMFYGAATKKAGYRLGYAESADGNLWKRKDSEIGITTSRDGWDSLTIAYPSVVTYQDRTYLFYNGNNMGATGFGYAVLKEW